MSLSGGFKSSHIHYTYKTWDGFPGAFESDSMRSIEEQTSPPLSENSEPSQPQNKSLLSRLMKREGRELSLFMNSQITRGQREPTTSPSPKPVSPPPSQPISPRTRPVSPLSFAIELIQTGN